MPRGNFWEATFDPSWDGPAEKASLTGLDGSSGLVKRLIVAADGNSVSVKWTRRDKTPRRFQECDFQLSVENALMSDCTFSRCRFKGSIWQEVKFSNCTFEACDFSGVTLRRCYFVSDCRFSNNSASAALFRVEDTAVSASAFISGLRTNVQNLPAGITAEYQQSRFVGTKQKIAKVLYSATRNEADLEYFYQAYEQLVRCTLDQGVEQHRFRGETRDRNSPWEFARHSFSARVERWIVCRSGWLTNWGRSVFRACLFLVAVVAGFAGLYTAVGHHGGTGGVLTIFGSSVLEAVNVTLVAGYTAYYREAAPLLGRVLWVVNLALGLFWYSLIIPVLSRRILR